MVFLVLNCILSDFYMRLAGCKLQLYFQRWEYSSRLNFLFYKTELHAVPEASEYDSIDVVSLFVFVRLDKCCGFPEAANITAIFSEYVDLVALFFWRHMPPEWTAKNIYFLEW